MIESIQFKNFKCLRDTTLPLSPCTILVGPNGSGKTTVLQALEAVSGRRGFTFDEVITAQNRTNDAARIEVRLNWGDPCSGTSRWTRWDRGDGPLMGHDGSVAHRHGEVIEKLIARIRVYSLHADAIASPVELQREMELAPDGAGLAGVLTRLQDRERERFEALNAELGRWLPEFDRVLLDLDNNKQRVLLLRTREGHHAIPATGVSQGTLLALTILTIAHLPNPPFLVGLEEPDRGIHPYLLRHVQDAIYRLSNPESCGEKRDPVQVIATTHSPYFIDLFKDHPEEIVVANKVGADVQFRRLTDVPHFGEMLGDSSLGEAWYTGFLGGVPAES